MKEIAGLEISADELDSDEEMLLPVGAIIAMLNQHKNHGRVILCYCRSGIRSLEAVRLLRALGYPNAVSIKKGVGLQDYPE